MVVGVFFGSTVPDSGRSRKICLVEGGVDLRKIRGSVISDLAVKLQMVILRVQVY